MTNDYHNLKFCCLCANIEWSLLMPWLIWQKHIQLGEDFKWKKRIGEVSISIIHCLVRNPLSVWSSTRAEWSTAACKPAQNGELCRCRLIPRLPAKHSTASERCPWESRKGWQGKRGNLACFNSLFTELLHNYRKCVLIQYLYLIGFIQENNFGFGLTRFELQNKLCNYINQVSLLWEWQPILPQ